MNVPNLDAMTLDELRQFQQQHVGGVNYHMLFPKQHPKVAMLWTQRLVRYAELKAKAMQHRLNGAISMALAYEAAADSQYNELPAAARW